MRAAWYEKFGAAADVIHVGEVETPVAAAGEVLVRLHASAVNPSDTKKRAGSFPKLLDEGFVIPNSDGAGIIEAVGDGIDKARVGQRVWVYEAHYGRRFGTAAEYVAVDSRRAPLLPGEIGFDVGSCLGIPAMTAHRCVFSAGAVAGKTLVITGAAGRVGYYAVQWASQAGATVIATASNEDDARACEAAGAAHIVSHRSASYAADVLAANGGHRVDRIIELEFGANLAASLAMLKPSGTIVTYGSAAVPQPAIPFYQMMYLDITVQFVIVYAMPEDAKQHAVADITAALENGSLEHRVAARMPLDDIATANEIIEQGTIRGAVILTID